jgi:hypothetical protein
MGKTPKLWVAVEKTKQCAKEKGFGEFCDGCAEDYGEGGTCALALDVCHEIAKDIERRLRVVRYTYDISQFYDGDEYGSKTTVEKFIEGLEDDLAYYQSEGKRVRPAALDDIDHYRRQH